MKDKKIEVSFKSCTEVTPGAEVFLFILLGSERVRGPCVRGQPVASSFKGGGTGCRVGWGNHGSQGATSDRGVFSQTGNPECDSQLPKPHGDLARNLHDNQGRGRSVDLIRFCPGMAERLIFQKKKILGFNFGLLFNPKKKVMKADFKMQI